jgi:hypothetical protein
MSLVVHLESGGNPDFGQTDPLSPPIDVVVESLEHARAEFIAYRERWHLGGGNMTMRSGVVTEDGKPLCRFSYNGCCWDLINPGNKLDIEVLDWAKFGRFAIMTSRHIRKPQPTKE